MTYQASWQTMGQLERTIQSGIRQILNDIAKDPKIFNGDKTGQELMKEFYKIKSHPKLSRTMPTKIIDRTTIPSNLIIHNHLCQFMVYHKGKLHQCQKLKIDDSDYCNMHCNDTVFPFGVAKDYVKKKKKKSKL